MPFYSFVISDGVLSTDVVDLPDIAAARREASRVIAQLASSEPDELWSEGALRLSVQDAKGLILFEIDVVATTAPVMSRQART